MATDTWAEGISKGAYKNKGTKKFKKCGNPSVKGKQRNGIHNHRMKARRGRAYGQNQSNKGA